MLVVDVPGQEYFDENSNKFVQTIARSYRFEHSLLSITQWEHKYLKPFLTNNDKTEEEILDYIFMMCLDELDVADLTPDMMEQIIKYVSNDKVTATTIKSSNDSGSRRVMTSEYIYACMAIARIPFECETWNIYRLLMVLSVSNELQKPPQKMSRDEQLEQQRRLNAERRAKAKSGG